MTQTKQPPAIPGRFTTGKGLILDKAIYALFNKNKQGFETKRGRALVLTHECDIEPSNERVYNEMALVCPIIPFHDVVTLIAGHKKYNSDDKLRSYFSELGAGQISQLTYMPPISQTALPLGAVLYLNTISSSYAPMLSLLEAEPSVALTAEALLTLSEAVSNHFLRPKVDPLPLDRS